MFYLGLSQPHFHGARVRGSFRAGDDVAGSASPRPPGSLSCRPLHLPRCGHASVRPPALFQEEVALIGCAATTAAWLALPCHARRDQWCLHLQKSPNEKWALVSKSPPHPQCSGHRGPVTPFLQGHERRGRWERVDPNTLC